MGGGTPPLPSGAADDHIIDWATTPAAGTLPMNVGIARDTQDELSMGGVADV